MSCLSSANFEIIPTEEQNERQSRKPILVSNRRKNNPDCVTQRVTAVVDLELANGSLPA